MPTPRTLDYLKMKTIHDSTGKSVAGLAEAGFYALCVVQACWQAEPVRLLTESSALLVVPNGVYPAYLHCQIPSPHHGSIALWSAKLLHQGRPSALGPRPSDIRTHPIAANTAAGLRALPSCLPLFPVPVSSLSLSL